MLADEGNELDHNLADSFVENIGSSGLVAPDLFSGYKCGGVV